MSLICATGNASGYQGKITCITVSQIRKSSKNVKSTIVEGYGRRIYKAEYLKFLVYALASNDETRDHLETLYETKSLSDEVVYNRIRNKINIEGRELHDFYLGVEKNHIPRL